MRCLWRAVGGLRERLGRVRAVEVERVGVCGWALGGLEGEGAGGDGW